MKRNFLLIALICMAAVAFSQVVICEGLAGGCAGSPPVTRDYLYIVRAPSSDSPILRFEVGTADGNSGNYLNIVNPSGYTFSIVQVPSPHYAFTPKFSFSPGPIGNAQYLIVWTATGAGVNQGVFGFNHVSQPQNVAWRIWTPGRPPGTGPPYVENWGAPVGTGQGPVHGPE